MISKDSSLHGLATTLAYWLCMAVGAYLMCTSQLEGSKTIKMFNELDERAVAMEGNTRPEYHKSDTKVVVTLLRRYARGLAFADGPLRLLSGTALVVFGVTLAARVKKRTKSRRSET